MQYFGRIIVYSVILGCSIIGCSENAESDKTAQAILYRLFQKTDTTYILGEETVGQATFLESEGMVVVRVDLKNLPPNTIHAVHIHNGTCGVPSGHWNAQQEEKQCFTKSLGKHWSKPFIGDIGNVSVSYEGTGYLEMKTDLWTIGSGQPNDVTGLVIFVHETLQDFTKECFEDHNHTHQHNNPKIACGTIQ